jgi:hypothetical protein
MEVGLILGIAVRVNLGGTWGNAQSSVDQWTDSMAAGTSP